MQFRLFALLATVALTLASPLHIRRDNNDNNDNNKISGNDGSGDQIVGNNGQNAGNAASNTGKVRGDLTIQQATRTSAGLLGSVFGSGDLGVQCSPINVAALAVQVPVNKMCDAKAACCQGDNTQNGVVNVGCIALASLL